VAAYALERKRIDSAIVDGAIQDLSGQSFAEVFEDSRDPEPDDPIFQMESSSVSEFVVAAKKKIKRGAPIFIALLAVLLIIAGIRFFKLDDSDTVTAFQNEPVPKLDSEKTDPEKAPSLPQRNLSLVEADPEKPLSLPFPDDHLVVYFKHNSFEISDASLGILNRLAKHIINKQETKILITGYTDSTGPKSYNDTISMRRAETVKNYLINKGIKLSRITAMGLGAQDFIASNETESGRKLNRRVEIDIKIDKTHL
jgi:outer membrane protein OmpA-like peptidoglycan-associated protein